MDNLLLATQEVSLYSHLTAKARYGVEWYTSDFELQGFPADRTLIILDDLHYRKLSLDDKSKIANYLKIIVLPVSKVDTAPDDYQSNMFVLFFVGRKRGGTVLSPLIKLNVEILIQSLFERLQSARRLNSYIVDSFQNIIDTHLLQRQKEEIENLNAKLHELSQVDYLTNLLNRRAFLENLEMEKKRAIRNRWRLQAAAGVVDPPFTSEDDVDFSTLPRGELVEHIGIIACLIIDIDHFKIVNDTYGHLMGDEVLRHFGITLKQKGLFRDNDIIGRYGGEEFIVVLPDTSSEHACTPANRLREAIKSLVFKTEEGQEFSVTLSVGISQYYPSDTRNEELIHRADKALYFAKQNGRDQVQVYETLPKK